MKKELIYSLLIGLCLGMILCIPYSLNIIPHKTYNNEYFNITTYVSKIDKDKDGIEDQKDILNNTRNYIATKPKYKSKYYSTGYSDDEYGVCTDVVAFAFLNSGYDLKELVNNDIKNNRDKYNIETIDKNIDFRRVRNLLVYFQNNAISLTTDTTKINEWQGGDIVVFKKHIGIISDKRNSRGVPFVIHHANPYQFKYEEDILEKYSEIIGHFRIS